MTSKISCIKLIRENIRHRAWLAAVCALAFLLMMPVYSILYLNSTNGPGYERDAERLASFLYYLPTLFNCSRLALFSGILAVLALLCALTGFWHIHSREKLDFYHSLPVRRERLYASCYLSGLVMLYVPYLICAALTAAVVLASGLVPLTSHMAGLCLQSVLGGILAVFVLYNACVFAVMLAGRTVTAVLGCAAVSVYPLIVLYSINLMQTDYFHTFYTSGPSLADRLAAHASPAGLYLTLLQKSTVETFSPAFPAAALLISAVLLAGSFLLYRIYPSEAAGNALAFPVSAPILKVLICIPCSIFATLIILDFMMVPGELLTIPLVILAAVVLCAVIDFIFHPDLRELLKGWKSTLISIAGAAAVICIFQFDLTGYDTYIPEESSVKAIAFYPDSFSYYFTYPGYDAQTNAPAESDVPSGQNNTAYALAQSGIANLKDGILPDSVYETASTHTDSEYINAVFHYKLNSGRTVARQYAILRDDAEKALLQFLADEDYRRELFPVTQVDKSLINRISITDQRGVEEPLELNAKQREALLAAYETDLMNADPDTLVNGTEVAQLHLYIPDQDINETAAASDIAQYAAVPTYCMSGLYIYPEYSSTLDFLASCGYTPGTEIDPADVASLNVTVFTDTASWENLKNIRPELSNTALLEESDGQISAVIRLEEDIALILDNVRQKHTGMLDDPNTSGGYLEIAYKNGDYGFPELE